MTPLATYQTDLAAWSADQARRLRQAKPGGLDWKNLAEEIESLGRSDRRAIGSALKVILEHLIKWRFQAERRTASSSDSIDEHRDRIQRIVEDSPSLRGAPEDMLEIEYQRARRKALRDMGAASKTVPAGCPFALHEVLDPDFWPAEG